MVKYKCQNCGKEWFTANTSEKQKCPDCGGLLKEMDYEMKNSTQRRDN